MIILGVVVHGQSLGRRLGFPTANITIDGDLEVENGVYRSSVVVDGCRYMAISNIGVKPTVGGLHRALESHILDFEGDLYGRFIEVDLIEKLRDEIHFESVDALREQVLKDIEEIKKLKNKEIKRCT
ncbi:MAG: riboflavin kinase [Rikenellaceae bacterium]